jgi:DNA-binding transcriptional regulator YiaG
MTIAEFMIKKNITIEEFASAINVSKSIVRLWENEASSPRLIHALRIRNFSENKIKLEDMLNRKEKGEFCQSKK